MNVSKINRISQGGGSILQGSFSFATVHHFDEKEAGKAKCVTLHDGLIYSATAGEGIRRWNAKTGSVETYLPASSFNDPIHSMCVVGRTLWVNTGSNTGSGNIVIYDLDTGQVKVKAFAAHKSEITCMAAGPGEQYVITGGVDFNVKLWSQEGSPIQTSNHHKKQVEAILLTPLTLIPASSDMALTSPIVSSTGQRIWTGGADGLIYSWPDDGSSPQFDPSTARSMHLPGFKPIKSMVYVPRRRVQSASGAGGAGHQVWVSCEGGDLFVVDAESGEVVKSLSKAHADTVDALACVGGEVWSGSRDKSIMSHDSSSYSQIFTLSSAHSSAPSQSTTITDAPFGGVKSLIVHSWFVWAFTSKGIKVLTSESIWRQEMDEADRLRELVLKEREEARVALEADRAKSRDLEIKMKELVCELERLKEVEAGAGAAAATAAAALLSAEGKAKEEEEKRAQAEKEKDDADRAREESEAARLESEKTKEEALKARDDAEAAKLEAVKAKVEAEKARDEAQRELDASKASSEDLKSERSRNDADAKDEKAKLAQELSLSKKDHAALKAEMDALRSSVASKAEEAEAKILESTQKIDEMEKEALKRQAEIDSLKAQEADLKASQLNASELVKSKAAEDAEGAGREMEDLRAAKLALESELNAAKKKAEADKASLAELAALRAKFEKSEKDLATLKKDHSTLQSSSESSKKDLAAAKERQAKADEDLADLRSKKEAAEKDLKEAAEIRDRALRDLIDAAEARDRALQDHETLLKVHQEKEDEMKSIRSRTDDNEALAKDLKAKLEASEKQARDLKNRAMGAELAMEGLKLAREEDLLAKKVAEDELSRMKQGVAALGDKARALEESLRSAEDKLRSVELSLGAEKDALESRLRLMQASHDQLESALRSEREAVEGRMRGLRDQLESLERRAREDDARIGVQDRLLEDERRRAGEAERKVAALIAEISALKNQADREEMDRLKQRVLDLENRPPPSSPGAKADVPSSSSPPPSPSPLLSEQYNSMSPPSSPGPYNNINTNTFPPSPTYPQPPPQMQYPPAPSVVINIPTGGMGMGGMGGMPYATSPSNAFGSPQSQYPPPPLFNSMGGDERGFLQRQIEDLQRKNQDFQDSLEEKGKQVDDLNKQLDEAYAREANQGEALKSALDSATAAKEERYQVQVALRATQKELMTLKAALQQQPLQPTPPPLPPPSNAGSRPPSRERSLSNGVAGGGGGGGGDQAKLQQLETALKQALSDYKTLLGDVSSIRAEAVERNSKLQAATEENESLSNELAVAIEGKTKAEKKVSAAMGEIDFLQRELERLQGDSRALEEMVDRLRAEVEDLKKRLASSEEALGTTKKAATSQPSPLNVGSSDGASDLNRVTSMSRRFVEAKSLDQEVNPRRTQESPESSPMARASDGDGKTSCKTRHIPPTGSFV